MKNEINVILVNFTEEIEGNTIVVNEENTFYNICNSTYIILSVLTFTIMIIFLFKYLKSTFPFTRS